MLHYSRTLENSLSSRTIFPKIWPLMTCPLRITRPILAELVCSRIDIYQLAKFPGVSGTNFHNIKAARQFRFIQLKLE